MPPRSGAHPAQRKEIVNRVDKSRNTGNTDLEEPIESPERVASVTWYLRELTTGSPEPIPAEQRVRPIERDEPIQKSKLANVAEIQPVFYIQATPEEIGARLRAAREAKGWSQTDLANAMGLKTKRTVQNIEKGNHSQSVSSVLDAMDALEISKL